MRRRYVVVAIAILAVVLAATLAWPWMRIRYVLFTMKQDTTVEEFEEKARRLAGYGPDIVPHLVHWLGQDSTWRQDIAGGTLAVLGAEAVPHMCDLASRKSTPMNARKEFVLLLFEHYDDMEEARETLADLSRDPDPEIRGFVLIFMQAQKAGKFRGGSGGTNREYSGDIDRHSFAPSALDGTRAGTVEWEERRRP